MIVVGEPKFSSDVMLILVQPLSLRTSTHSDIFAQRHAMLFL
jgi:hypothetical protein